jgi:DNA-binding transcriptional LysR family regulator
MVSLRNLSYLVALASEKHFGRAAKRCNVSQPSLSAAIRQLEADLNVPIVERGQRFRGLTPEGRRVLEWAHRILADCDSLRQELGTLRRGLFGHLRFGAIPSALPVVPLVTTQFYRRHPLVSITVLSQSSREIQRGLDEFELDVGLTYLDNEPLPNVRSMALYQERYFLVTSGGGGTLSERDSVTWAEAARQSLCLLTPDMQNRRIIDAVFRQVGCEPRAEIQTNSLMNILAHVAEGYWSSIMPRSALRMIADQERLRAIPLTSPEVRHEIGLVVPDREPMSPLASALFGLIGSVDLSGEIERLDRRLTRRPKVPAPS